MDTLSINDAPPDRYWVANPVEHYHRVHQEPPACTDCGNEIEAVIYPIAHGQAKCLSCALGYIEDHPTTPTYLQWMTEGDPRWWSMWFCSCDGCREVLGDVPK